MMYFDRISFRRLQSQFIFRFPFFQENGKQKTENGNGNGKRKTETETKNGKREAETESGKREVLHVFVL